MEAAASSPLRVSRLACRGYRNLEAIDLEPGASFNVIHGDNGAGKSNLLEAIHYLGSLRSFRGARTDDLIRLDGDVATLGARLTGHLAPRTFKVQLARGRARKLSIDDRRPRSIAAWHTSIQMVLFHAGHLALSAGGPDGRRAYLDRILEQMDPAYSATLASYTKALRSRNRLLKRGDDADVRSIRAFDELIATAGEIIGRARLALVSDLSPAIVDGMREVVGETLPVAVEYRPRVEPDAATLRRALAAALSRDLARGFTADGPHADDLCLEVRAPSEDRIGVRHHASQGQHRALALALKVAELHVLTRRVGRVPILLLDDVSSELDRGRNRRLFTMLARLGGQVFLTTTHPEFILLERERRDFRIDGGRLDVDG